MAKARVTCKCTVCGSEFEHTHMCRNRTEADSYERWAAENITICPSCYAAAKKAEAQAAQDKYLAAIADAHPLPVISGVSDKQVAYATSLRDRFITNVLARYNVDINKFFAAEQAIRMDALNADGISKLQIMADKAGMPLEQYFAAKRKEAVARAAGLADSRDFDRVMVVFLESNASKIIDALR